MTQELSASPVPRSSSTSPQPSADPHPLEALKVPDMRGLGGSDIPAVLIQTVQDHHKCIDSLEVERSSFAKDIESVNREYARKWKRMGFRERYLWRWVCQLLKGNVALMDEASALKVSEERLHTKAERCEKAIAGEQRKIKSALHTFLRDKDASYAIVADQKVAVEKVINANAEYLSFIDYARRRVSAAESTETLDFLTRSKAISLWSSSDNSAARRAINAVRYAGSRYQEALKKYGKSAGSIASLPRAVRVGDGLDTFLDFAVGGFDLGSIFSLCGLSDAAHNLSSLRREVAAHARKFEKHLEAADSYLSKRRKELETLCLQPTEGGAAAP